MPIADDEDVFATVKAKRQAAARARWQSRRDRFSQRVSRLSWYAVLAEAFLIALWPAGATVAMLLGFILLLVRFRAERGFHFRRLPLDVPVVLFVVISGASILMSPDKGFSFYNWYNLVGAYVLTYLLIGQTIRSPRDLRQLLAALGLSCVLVVLYGFYQFIFGIDISAMKWVDGNAFPELSKRVFSTWENPNILAGYLDAALCLSLGLLIKAGNRTQRIVLAVFMLALAACLAMTYSRGACLVLAAVFVLYGILRDWRVLAACIVVGGLIIVADPTLQHRLLSVFTTVDTSTEMRMAFWESTVAMIQDHPLLGIGWGAYWMVYPEYDFYLQGAPIKIVHAHNLYLNYMAEIGIPGAMAFFWFFFGSLVQSLRAKFRAQQPVAAEPSPFDLGAEGVDAELQRVQDSLPKEQPPTLSGWQAFCQWEDWRLGGGLALGIGLAILSIALNGLTDDLLFNIPSSMLLWLLAALGGVLVLNQTGAGDDGQAEDDSHEGHK